MVDVSKPIVKNESVGTMRFTSDMRQIGALLMILGYCAIVQPLSTIAAAIGPNGTTVDQGIPLFLLIGGLCLVKIGCLAIFIGYNLVVHDWGNKYLTAYSLVFLQTALIPYVTDATNIGKIAKRAGGFIPPTYAPTQADFNFVGAMGIIGLTAYAFAFVGSVAFMQFSLYAYQNDKPHHRNGAYYKGRMMLYSAVLFVAGLTQLMLGTYIMVNFDKGSLDKGPIIVAMYFVSFPEITVFVGLLQVLNGLWGIARSLGRGIINEKDFSFQISIFVAWILHLTLQVLTQIGYMPANAGSSAPATIVSFSVGLYLMPAFLDFKFRSVPNEMTDEFYDTSSALALAPSVPVQDTEQAIVFDDTEASA